MQNKRLLIFAAVLLASPAAAQPASRQHPEDHLEPERPAFSPHYDLLRHDLLHEACDTSVDVSMVALPSFVPEYAVGLRSMQTTRTGASKTVRLGAPYHIFVLAPQASIWTYDSIAGARRTVFVDDKNNEMRDRQIAQLKAGVPANSHDIKINHCEINISDVLGDRIVAVWGKMLMSAHYAAQYQGGTDGMSFNFNGSVRRPGRLEGALVASERDSATGTLAAVCEKKATLGELDLLTTELEQRLRRGEGQ